MATCVSERGNDLGGGLLGGQLRPLLPQASLGCIHGCVMAGAVTAGLPIGKGCSAPCGSALG